MGFVSVQVPEERVLEVYGLLANEDSRGPAAGTDEDSVSEMDWPEDVVLRAARESAEPMRELLRVLLEAGDDGVTTVEIAEELDLARGAASVAGMLGAFGRRCANRYKMTKPLWSDEWEELDDGGTTTRLTLWPAYRDALRRFLDRNGD